MHLSTVENIGGSLQIFEPTVGTRADHNLIDFPTRQFGGGHDIFGQMRHGNDGNEFRQIDLDGGRILRIGIGIDGIVRLQRSTFDILLGHVVERKQPRFRARFDRHVGNGQTIGHRQLSNAVAGKFERLIKSTVDADFPDQSQNNVLAANVFGFDAAQFDVDGFRDFEPSLAGSEPDGKIGGADAGRKGIDGAVSASVRIGADDEHARSDNAELRQNDVFNAHASRFVVMFDVMFFGEIAQTLCEIGGFNVFSGLKVIRNERNLIWIENGQPDLFKFFERGGTGDIVRHNEIELTDNQLTRLNVVETGVLRYDFFAHVHNENSPNFYD